MTLCALSDPHWLKLLSALAWKELCVCDRILDLAILQDYSTLVSQ